MMMLGAADHLPVHRPAKADPSPGVASAKPDVVAVVARDAKDQWLASLPELGLRGSDPLNPSQQFERAHRVQRGDGFEDQLGCLLVRFGGCVSVHPAHQ
jgi:hypothetical protein